MNFKLDKFITDRNNFPLILFPYKNWVSIKSATKFIPYEGSDIEFTNLHERQILLPGYPRSDDSDIFVCGYIKYEDSSQLTIIHEVEIKDYYKIDPIKTIKNFQHIWKCSEGDAIDYYHFIYSYNGDIFHNYTLKPINPTCRWKLPQLKFKLKLDSSEGSKISDSKEGIQIMNVHEDMLNEDIYHKCVIVIEEAAKYSFLSNYYDQVMEALLVSKDVDGNKIFHDKIKFDDSFAAFKKYECAIIYKNKDFVYVYRVENLSFLTMISNMPIANQNETWRVKDDIVIQC